MTTETKETPRTDEALALRGEPVVHPTYGTLAELVELIVKDQRDGFALRVGLEGALRWFSRQPLYAPAVSGERVREAKNAERYLKLRLQHWNDSNLFVVAGGKSRVMLGTDCPYGDRLDAAVDALPLAAQQEGK